MGKVVLELSMSLDGFIAGPKDDDKPDRELGGLDILHDWRFGGKSSTETEAYEVEKFKPMGAGIVGRRMLDLGIGPWGENPTFHMPIFVLSHETRKPITKQGGTTYTLLQKASKVPFNRQKRRRVAKISWCWVVQMPLNST